MAAHIHCFRCNGEIELFRLTGPPTHCSHCGREISDLLENYRRQVAIGEVLGKND